MKTTIYSTYLLTNAHNGNTYGYGNTAHCNYVNNIETDSDIINEVDFSFNEINDFKFLASGSGISSGTGFTATSIYFLIQKVLDGNELMPNEWRKYDITNQISGHTAGNAFSPYELSNTKFRIFLDGTNGFINYDAPQTYYSLDQTLNYPVLSGGTTENQYNPSFGSEEYFIGNVDTNIEAKIYSMNIDIMLNNYTCSTNNTWTTESTPYISEVGIYDINKVLVGIGKLTNPVKAGENNAIVFGLDF